jgi:hypothetical protein
MPIAVWPAGCDPQMGICTKKGCKFMSNRPKKGKASKTDKKKQGCEDMIDFAGDNKDTMYFKFAGDTGRACHCNLPSSL